MTALQVPTPRRATKAQRRARIALAGPTGSGKSYTALVIAKSLPGDGSIVGIDTEKGSMADYADIFEFDHVPIDSYNPELLIAMLAAYGDDYRNGTLIVDSMSHFWMGSEGMLEQVDNATARSRSQNAFATGWKDMRPVERKMIEALLAFPGHVIVTMRTKTEWVIVENEKGKKEPKKIGMKPEQRDGIEYEFGLVGDLDQDNRLVITKSRMGSGAPIIRNGSVVLKPDESFGKAIGEWLTKGVETPGVPEYVAQAKAATTRAELRALLAEVHRSNVAGAVVRDGDRALTLRELITEFGLQLPGDSPPPREEPPPAAEPQTPITPASASAMSAATNAAGMVHPRAEDEDQQAAAGGSGWAETWLADVEEAKTMGDLNRLVVALEREKRAGVVDEETAAALMQVHARRLREIRGKK